MTNTAAQDIAAIAAAGYAEVGDTDVWAAVQDESNAYIEGPNGTRAATKHEAAVVLKGVMTPQVTAGNAPEFSADETNHRFNHQLPAGYGKPVFPHPQV